MLLSINVLRSYQDHRLYYSAFSQSRHCSQQINKDLPAGLDLSVEHLTAAREVMGSIPKARPKTQDLNENKSTAFAQQMSRLSHGSDTGLKVKI